MWFATRRHRYVFPLSLMLIVGIALGANAQCSDAGVCAVSLTSADARAKEVNTFSIGYTLGKSGMPDDVGYNSLVAGISVSPRNGSRLTLTLPFGSNSGPLGRVTGVGDILAVWDENLYSSKENASLNVQIGCRIPTGASNAGSGLPMAYQLGLGSFDVLLGAGVSADGMMGGIGYQIAGSRNENEKVRLSRGDQFLVWGGYETRLEGVGLVPWVMITKQLRESSIADQYSEAGQFRNVPESDQLQVNVALEAIYELDSSLFLEVFGALPLLQRNVNVDGLKRALTVSAGCKAHF